MFTLDLPDWLDTTLSTFVVLTNMVLLLRPKLGKRARLLRRFVIIITNYMLKFTNGLTVTSINSVEHQHHQKSMKKSPTIFSMHFEQKVRQLRKSLSNNTATPVKLSWPIDW